jgi:hypothetical protein
MHAGPGGDGVDVKGAAPVRPAFVADDAHHGDLAPGEPGGQGWRQWARRDETTSPFDRGLLIRRPLRPSSRGPWCAGRGYPWIWSGLGPARLYGLRSGLGGGIVEYAGAVRPPYLIADVVEFRRWRSRNGVHCRFGKHDSGPLAAAA